MTLPLPSLCLLVPPVRLLSASMWQVAQQNKVMHYDKLADFIGLVTEMVPELINPCHKGELVLGLRARLVLELCQGNGLANLHSIQFNLDKIHACTVNLSCVHQNHVKALQTSYTNFSKLVQKLISVPFEKDHFFQEVFPVNYGSAYNLTLQQLVSEFLSRLEQLLPTPNFTQTATMLAENASEAEEFGQLLTDPSALNSLLRHHSQLGVLGADPHCRLDDTIVSTLAIPPEPPTERYVENEENQSNKWGSEAGGEISDGEDSVESATVQIDERLPSKESGVASKLLISPQRPLAHQTLKMVKEHIRRIHPKSHRITTAKDAPRKDKAPARKDKAPARKARGRSDGGARRKAVGRNQKGQGKDAGENGGDDGQKMAPVQKRKAAEKCVEEDCNEDDDEEEEARLTQMPPKGDDRRFLSTRQVNKHFSEEETTCPECQKAFELPNQLKNHLKLHALPYRCLQCEKGFTSKSGYYQHQRVHKRGRTHTCAHCGMGFLCGYSLKQHERMHTEGPSHLCPECGKRFSKVSIVRHMRMHRGQKDYLCTECGKSFLSSGELLLHTRSHTRETPYTCTHCGKGFATKSHLVVHNRSHTGERPYPCIQCPKRFITLGCLKRHMLCHDGVKPFRCPKCDKEFSQNGNLRRHLTTHSSDLMT